MCRRGARDEISDQRRCDHQQRKRHREKVDGDEGGGRKHHEQPRLQAAFADAKDRLDDHNKDSSLDTVQRTVDQRNAAAQHIDEAQPEHHQRAGQDEQQPCRQPATQTVQRPADVSRKLLRLRSRQQHAVVQGVEIPRLVDPFFLVDQNAVHGRDLACRSAKTQTADLEPDLERLTERRHGGAARCHPCFGCCCHEYLSLLGRCRRPVVTFFRRETNPRK